MRRGPCRERTKPPTDGGVKFMAMLRASGWSIHEVSRRTGIPHATLSRWARGTEPAHQDVLLRLRRLGEYAEALFPAAYALRSHWWRAPVAPVPAVDDIEVPGKPGKPPVPQNPQKSAISERLQAPEIEDDWWQE